MFAKYKADFPLQPLSNHKRTSIANSEGSLLLPPVGVSQLSRSMPASNLFSRSEATKRMRSTQRIYRTPVRGRTKRKLRKPRAIFLSFTVPTSDYKTFSRNKKPDSNSKLKEPGQPRGLRRQRNSNDKTRMPSSAWNQWRYLMNLGTNNDPYIRTLNWFSLKHKFTS